MSIKIGSISAKDIYIGSTPVKEIRLGSTLIWSREPEKTCYTLTLNLEGDYDAFNRDGYTIYVDGNEFARTSSSGTYSIPKGASISTYNNSDGQYGYKYFESINPTPSYNSDGSWIMDKDYTINVKAERDISSVFITINTWWPTDSGSYIGIGFTDPSGQIRSDYLYFSEQKEFEIEV